MVMKRDYAIKAKSYSILDQRTPDSSKIYKVGPWNVKAWQRTRINSSKSILSKLSNREFIASRYHRETL